MTTETRVTVLFQVDDNEPIAVGHATGDSYVETMQMTQRLLTELREVCTPSAVEAN